MTNRRTFIKKSLLLSAFTSANLSLFANTQNMLLLNNTQRIKTPLLKDEYDVFKEISWKKAFDIMQDKINSALKDNGTNGIALYSSANIDLIESYALSKLFKAGFRSNNILSSSFKNDDIYNQSRIMTYGIDGSSGTYDDLLFTDVLLSFDVHLDKYENQINSKIKANKTLKLINISTSTLHNQNAYLNINIKSSSYSLLFKYIIRELIYNNDNKINWDYIKKHTVFANYKNDIQWEISYNDYRKSFDMYTLDYVAKEIKYIINEDLEKFKNKITELKDLVMNKSTKIFSLTSDIINESSDSLSTNLLLQSLHILLNKHSRPGCGVFNISNKKSPLSISGVGLNSNRLASNMYIKYIEHRKVAQSIWNVPKDTINPIGLTPLEIKENIKNNITKFLWINGNDENDSYLNKNNKIYDIGNNKDLFIVSSDSFMNDTSRNANLILPTTITSESQNIHGNYQREVSFNKQENIPYGDSMSLLWQTIELSKRFIIKDMYTRVKVDDKQAIKNIILSFMELGYKKEDSLYKILFYNEKTKLFSKNIEELNTESNGDSRNIIGSDGGLFKGYRYLMQEYLFEEYRQFTLNKAYDLRSYKNYKNSKRPILWPYVKNKEVKYRFNPIDDIYALRSASKDKNYSFYGRMGEKSLKFGNLNEITNKDKKSLKYRAKIFTTLN